MVQLKKAQRKRAKLKIGVSGASGSGKTLSSLLLAFGLIKGENPSFTDEQVWDKIVIIDSENGSGELYVGTEVGGIKVGNYNAVTLTSPFTPDKYIEALNVCKNADMYLAIIDSTSQLWAGQGGLLEMQGNTAKRTGNSYTAWREVTPQYNLFVDTMLQIDMHIIATMRSKTEYIQEKDEKGRSTVRKVGMAPIQRDGMEYEFTTFLDIDSDHLAFGSKDRTGIVDQKYFKVTPQTGLELAKWLDGSQSADTPEQVIAVSKAEEVKAEEPTNLKKVLDDITAAFKTKLESVKTDDEKTELKNSIYTAIMNENDGNKNYLAVKDLAKAQTILNVVRGIN